MTFALNLPTLLGIFALFQGLVFAVALHAKKASIWAVLFFLAFSCRLVPFLLDWGMEGANRQGLLLLPLYFNFFCLPLYHLMAKDNPAGSVKKGLLLFFMPGLLEFVVLGLLFCYPSVSRQLIWENGVGTALALSGILFQLTYAPFLYKDLNPNPHQQASLFSTFHLACITALLIFGAAQLLLPATDSGLLYGLRTGFAALNLVLVVSLGIQSSKNQVPEPGSHLSFEKLPQPVKMKTTANLTPQPDDALAAFEAGGFQRIHEYMRTHKPYLRPDLTLAALADEVNMAQRTLSNTIKTFTGHNFNKFVNAYRVTEALELLANPAKDNLTMQGIANEAGFNSKATFYTSFQEHLGCAPTAFKKLRLPA